MGILTDDDGLVDAALSEMLSLPLDQRTAMDPHHDVTGLLVKHHLGQVSIACPSFRLSLVTVFVLLGRHPKSDLGSSEGDLCATHVEGAENTSRIVGSTKRPQRSCPRSAGFRGREFRRNTN